jgi:hypothetical protein
MGKWSALSGFLLVCCKSEGLGQVNRKGCPHHHKQIGAAMVISTEGRGKGHFRAAASGSGCSIARHECGAAARSKSGSQKRLRRLKAARSS